MAAFYLVDGKPIRAEDHVISCLDRGLLYGFNLFETMLVHRGQIMLPEPHLARMACSAQELELVLPCSMSRLAAMCQCAADETGFESGVLRVTVTAGSSNHSPGHSIVSVRQDLPYAGEQYAHGVVLMTLDYPRNEKSKLVRHKTGNYLENLLARQAARQKGFADAIFCNTRGLVAECTASNIFMVQNNSIITPPVTAGLLPGITRGLVLELAYGAGLPCRQDDFYLWELMAADECFITNSLMGIMPVAGIDNKPIGIGQIGPETKKVMALYEKWISQFN